MAAGTECNVTNRGSCQCERTSRAVPSRKSNTAWMSDRRATRASSAARHSIGTFNDPSRLPQVKSILGNSCRGNARYRGAQAACRTRCSMVVRVTARPVLNQTLPFGPGALFFWCPASVESRRQVCRHTFVRSTVERASDPFQETEAHAGGLSTGQVSRWPGIYRSRTSCRREGQ